MRLKTTILLSIILGGGLIASPPHIYRAPDSSQTQHFGIVAPEISAERKIVPWKLGVFSATAIGITGYAYSRMDEWWGQRHSEAHIKHNDWAGDNLAQTDEISHFFITYKIAQTGIQFSRWTGFSDRTSRIIGSSIALAIMTWVEYPVDTYNPGQGFGYSDMLANILGIGLAAARDKFPEKLSNIDIRFSIKDPANLPNELIAKSLAGNDAYIYWLAINPTRNFPIHPAIGYSANHIPPDYKAEREVYLGFGTSAGEIIGLFDRRLQRKLDLFNCYEFSFYFRLD